jgi:protein-S-isoprenylcysteine O-methyltransferase Ste14
MEVVYGKIFTWIGRKRSLLSALFGMIALLNVLWGKALPMDLDEPSSSPFFWIFWILLFTGVVIRIWAAGIIRKNSEVAKTGVYRMVRHPLYLGTLLIYLSFFLACGDMLLGIILFALMYFVVYYPRMLQEEKKLFAKFPGDYQRYMARTPRLVPKISLIPDAFRNSGFSLRRSYHNFGIRSLTLIVFLPLLCEVLHKVKGIE